jgi:non-specific serine/threonine protein kinase/serine/threonine-protein kinase
VSTDRHARVKELFLAVCERSPEDRSAYLETACGGDQSLRSEVEELLAFHSDEIELDSAARSAIADLESIANYRVIQRVGEGGMGEVYEAEQTEPVRRRVALKVIKWGMDTKEVLARFESERQALALMNHPNIARVYEAGATSSGRPYFAMEYVKGVAITEYCDIHRLTIDERLELFCQVCEGVQHAHQRGVIHRDMKPSNVMVAVADGRPVPKIIDFGVAKATSQRLTERTVFTELGQWIGTPEYMSPEQAEMTGLDIDTRTDVYSLGVVLYELLVGAQPFESTTLRSAGFDEMRRRIREEEPPRPSTRVSALGDDSEVAASRRRTEPSALVRELRGDLDWIVMRALDKDRTRRYATPVDLARDVRRHMANQPVEASPPGTWYRVTKFMRRHRVGVAAGLVVLVALVVGVVGTSIGLIRAKREAETSRQVVRLLSEVFGDMNPAASGSAESFKEVLGRGAARIDRELIGQPLVQAQLKFMVGQVRMGLGDFSGAGPPLEHALQIRLELLGEQHPRVADSLHTLGVQRENMGAFDEARRLYERALEVYRDMLGPDSGATGQLLSNLCHVHWRLGRYDRALEQCDRALANLTSIYGPESVQVSNVLFNKAVVLNELGRSAEARPLAERVLEIRKKVLGPTHTQVGWALHDLGYTLLNLADNDAARPLLERALAVQETALGPDSHAVSMCLQQLTRLCLAEGDLDAAREASARALAIRESVFGPDHPDLVWMLRLNGVVLRRHGDFEGANRMFERALELTERAYGKNHLEYARTLESIAYLGVDARQARDHYTRAMEIREAVFGRDNRSLGFSHYNLACVAGREQNRDLALEHLRRALELGWSWSGMFEDADLEPFHGDPEFEALMDEFRHLEAEH